MEKNCILTLAKSQKQSREATEKPIKTATVRIIAFLTIKTKISIIPSHHEFNKAADSWLVRCYQLWPVDRYVWSADAISN